MTVFLSKRKISLAVLSKGDLSVCALQRGYSRSLRFVEGEDAPPSNMQRAPAGCSYAANGAKLRSVWGKGGLPCILVPSRNGYRYGPDMQRKISGLKAASKGEMRAAYHFNVDKGPCLPLYLTDLPYPVARGQMS